jgi:hypothetical protein
MSFPPRCRFAGKAAFVALAFAGASTGAAPPVPVYQSNVALTASETEAVEEFQDRIKEYAVRQKKLAATLPRLPKKATPEQIHEHERALSGMTPAVLKALPKLEEEFEYRFIGKRLILMDANAQIVIDFTDDVLP